jgi:hypothetical protein
MKRFMLNCHCGTIEHAWFFTDGENDFLYVTSFLEEDVWYNRIKNAIKYIFGFKCSYGHFSETILDVERSRELVEFLQSYIENQTTKKRNQISLADLLKE